ncbi:MULTISPECIES: MgtC/SapB family protein [Agrobacterium]|uniref:MgtC/SapB family protein n=1 Tax=Agrobacterium TaxID=357 RepID=UPI000369D36B|nr:MULTISPECIES: MgtC/SapB family protein [Agrobacterium]EPR18255.1 membrane protein [Agrobacterium radiobacter DSM 30147]KDR89278.1 membrane protein [Agrobacterium tumefaciens GW4]KVK45345.1 membrane protein [Agrobacterium sp. LY4]
MELLIPRLGLALAIGLLVGLERGWRERDAPAGSRTAGIRTYGIAGLLGGVFGVLAAEQNSAFAFAAGFLGFAFSFSWFKLREARHDNDFSVTGVVAALCVFALGGLAVTAQYQAAAAAGGAALAALLAGREVLHRLLKRLTWIELRSALVLAVMTAVGLSILPNRTIDPWGGFNPWEIWLFTVLSATISYCGYIAVRLLGSTRGLLVTGLAGALVSSTAVTASFGQKAKSGENVWPLAGVAALAAAVSLLRVLVIVLALSLTTFSLIAPVTLAAALVLGLSGAGLIRLQDMQPGQEIDAKNPFELVPLAIFATLFAATRTLNAVLLVWIGAGGFIALTALSAIFDADVAVLSALRTSAQNLSPDIVASAILAALAANAVGRVFVAAVSGTLVYCGLLTAASVVAAGVGSIIYLLIA